jgi:tetratricopeptide (TPR) repeat protein
MKFHASILNWSLFVVMILILPACNNDSGIKKVGQRNTLERQAKKLAESGQLTEAVKLYQEAIKPELINQEHEKSTAIGAMTEIYKWQSKYNEALTVYGWFLRHEQPTQTALDEQREIMALIEYQERGNASEILKHINYFKKEHAHALPPKGYTFGAAIIISDILRLYDTIGDYDTGIAYIDECMAFFKKKDIEKYGEYRPGYADEEFLKVREGFEREKANGGPTCGRWGTKDENGVYCIGDATKALIQSDYFPW